MINPLLTVLLGVMTGQAPAAPAQPGPGSGPNDTWKLEVVHRKAPFAPLEGLVVRQDSMGIELRQVIRKPGRPTFIITVQIPEDQIDHVDLLDAGERQELLGRLDRIQRERRTRFARLKMLDRPVPMGKDMVDPPQGLERADWPGEPPGSHRAWMHKGFRFTLLTTVRMDMAELCALQLEQVFIAYESLLPARLNGEPVLVLLTSSLDEWQVLCKSKGRNVLNPAWYDTATGEVGFATDQARLDARMEELRNNHSTKLTELAGRADDMRKVYGGKLPPEIQKSFDQALRTLKDTVTSNERVMRLERDKLFARVNHEAFHAYLSRFVMPPGRGSVPPWLNEGLAQLFESALVEDGDLRADHADLDRVRNFRAEIIAGKDMPLSDLLTLPSSKFIVTGAEDKELSRRAYLASWALCAWLVLDKGRLRLEEIDKLVQAGPEKTTGVQNFEIVFGMSLAEAQSELRDTFRKGAPGKKTPPSGAKPEEAPAKP